MPPFQVEGSLDVSVSSSTPLLDKTSVHSTDRQVQPEPAQLHISKNGDISNGSSSSSSANGNQHHHSTNGLNGNGSRKNSGISSYDENNLNGNGKTSSSSCKTEWVRLNIGGKYFVTTKTTLCKYPQSFFYKLCQDDPSIGLTTDKVSDHSGLYWPTALSSKITYRPFESSRTRPAPS